MATIADLLIKMSVDAAQVRTEIDKVKRQSSEAGKAISAVGEHVKKAWKDVGDQLKQAVGVAAAVGAAVAFKDTIKGAIDAADAMDEMSQRVALSVESLSKLGYAAKFSGVDTDVLEKGMKHLSETLTAAAGGDKEKLAWFRKLGLSAAYVKANVNDLEKVFGDVSEAFAGFGTSAAKSTLAGEGFGEKIGTQLIPVMNNGRAGLKALGDQLERAGGVLTSEMAKQAADFNDTIDRLGAASRATGMAMAHFLLPSLQRAADQLERLNGAHGTGGFLASMADLVSGGALSGVEGKFGIDIPALSSAIQEDLSDIGNAVVTWSKGGGFSPWNALGKEAAKQFNGGFVQGSAEDLINTWSKAFGSTHLGMLSAAGAFKGGAPGGGKPASGKSRQQKMAEDAETALEGAIKRANEGLAEREKLLAMIASPFDNFIKQAKEIDKALIAGNITEEESIDIYRRIRQVYADTLPDAIALKQAMEDGKAVTLAAASPAQKLSFELAKIGALAHAGAIDFVTMNEAIQDAMIAHRDATPEWQAAKNIIAETLTPLEQYREKLKEIALAETSGVVSAEVLGRARKAAAEAAQEAAIAQWKKDNELLANVIHGSSDIIANNLVDGFRKGADGMLAEFAEMLKRMVAMAIAARLEAAILGAVAGGGAPTAAASLAPAAAGALSSISAPSHASGFGPRATTAELTRASQGHVTHTHIVRFEDLAARTSLEQWFHRKLAREAVTR